jgi:nicotinate-nucleotide adenylyltransferase
MTRVLLFGGSFDPPHNSHLQLPREVMAHLKFDRVLYVPVFQSPLKEQPPTPWEHRLAMLELALDDCPWATISTLEIDRGGTSYTIDTIESLQNEYEELRLLIGSDQWIHFKKWHRWQDILRQANPVVIPREGYEVEHERVFQIGTQLGASSDIRALIRNGKSISELVPTKVETYITENGLYL